MTIVAPEERTAAPAQESVPPAQPATRPWITATRKRLVRRFPSLGFAVHTGGLPYYEVLLATDPSLLDAASAGRRTATAFYSSRQDGGLRTSRGADEIYLVPSAVLRGFASATPKPSAIYYAVVAYPDANGSGGVGSLSPGTGAPSVALSADFAGDTLERVLGVRAAQLQVVASAAAEPSLAAAPAPASTPAPETAVPEAAPAIDPETDAAVAEDGYALLAANPERLEPGGSAGSDFAAGPAPVAAADVPYDDGFDDYSDGWDAPDEQRQPAHDALGLAQDASFPADFPEPEPLPDDELAAEDAPSWAAELDGVEEDFPYSQLDDAEPAQVAAPTAALRPLKLTIDEKRTVIERIAGGESGSERYGAINSDGEFKGRFGPTHSAYQHHHIGLSYGIIQFTQESGNLGQLLTMMRDRDADAFGRIFGSDADELIRVTTAAGPPSSESLDGRSARTQPVGGADLWEEPWIARFRAAGREPAFQAAQNELAATAFVDPMLEFAGNLGLDTDRALTMAVDRAVQMGVTGARHWIVAAAGPISTPALRQQALTALGFEDVAAFQRAYGQEPDNLWGPLTHAALVGALRGLGAASPIQLPTLEQMLDSMVRRADADAVFWAERVRKLRTATGFADTAYAR
jgi:hypothetical protein